MLKSPENAYLKIYPFKIKQLDNIVIWIIMRNEFITEKRAFKKCIPCSNLKKSLVSFENYFKLIMTF